MRCRRPKSPSWIVFKDNVIADPRPIPCQSQLQTDEQAEQSEEAVDKPTEAVLNVLADDDKSPEEEMFPEIKYSPTGKPIPDGYHWGGTRRVKTYKGSKRPDSIPSDLWRMLSPKDREKLIVEEADKMSGNGSASSSAATRGSKKKKETAASARKLPVNPSPSGEPVSAESSEIIPVDRPKFCVPAMRKAAPAKDELHRPELREMIKRKIQELEFKVALEEYVLSHVCFQKMKPERIPRQTPL